VDLRCFSRREGTLTVNPKKIFRGLQILDLTLTWTMKAAVVGSGFQSGIFSKTTARNFTKSIPLTISSK